MSKWWVYILCCADDTLYTGVAKDVAKRLDEHNRSPKAAKYTRVRRPVAIVYMEPVADRSSALKREMAIKSLPRKQKKKLVIETAAASGSYADKLEISLCCIRD